MSAKVDVVIVNWNSGKQLRECIESLNVYAASCLARIVVVDNGSVDGSEALVEGMPRVELIRANANLGFARACNLGARRCSAEYLLFFNPDARVMENTLETVLGFMESGQGREVGICGIRLLDDGGEVQRHCARFPSLRSFVGISTGLDRLFPRLFPGLFLHEFDHLSSRAVDHVIGAFFFVRKRVFDRLDGFDERFFVYLEDLDFSLRAKKEGWTVYYLAEAIAFHRGGGTSDQVKAKRLFYSLRSRIVYAFRHFPRGSALGVVALTLLVEPWPRLLRALLRGSAVEAKDTARAFAMLWQDIPSTLRAGMSRE
jgi:GT2 family glycosyltransferase